MHFKTWNAYQSFSNSVRSKRRYIFDEETDQFLKVVAHTSEKRKKFIKKGSQLWRAQKGHNLTISVALFRINRQISVIDCTSNTPKIFLENPPPEERENAVWGYINEAFSVPIENDDDRSEYVPTQILAELFRDIGFDGIAYKSMFGKGYNIALFNLDDAIAEKCSLVKTKSLKFEFEDNVSPYNSITY